MFNHELSTIQEFYQPTSFESIGSISFQNANILPYLVAKDIKTHQPYKFDFQKVKTSIDLQWRSYLIPEGQDSGEEPQLKARVGMRHC